MARDLLVNRFGGGANSAGELAAPPFGKAESLVLSALLHRNGYRLGRGQLRSGIAAGVELTDRDPKLCYVRYFANPNPQLKAGSRR